MIFIKECRPILAEVLGRTLEETAFMLVEDSDASMPAPCDTIEAQIPFSGRVNGICWLVVPESDARQLAGEMLGETATGPGAEDAAGNAVGELLNILTAWILEAWWGSDSLHTLGLPITSRKPLQQTCLASASEEERVIAMSDSGCVFMACITMG